MILVSIIMAAYNSEKYIGEAIQSVLNQTYTNWELIIVNDGSTDNTEGEIFKFNDNRIKYFYQSNQGQCAATNIGIDKSTGEFIQYLDADDFMDENKIMHQIKEAVKFDPDTIFISKWDSITDDKIIETSNVLYRNYKSLDWIITKFSNNAMMANSSYLIPKKLVLAAGNYREDLTLNNDLEYFTRTVLTSKNVVFVEGSKTYYRRNIVTSLSKKKDEKSLESEFKAKILSINELLKVEDSDRTKIASCNLLLNFLYSINGYSSKYIRHVINFIQKEIKPPMIPLIGGKKFKCIQMLLGIKTALYFKNFYFKNFNIP